MMTEVQLPPALHAQLVAAAKAAGVEMADATFTAAPSAPPVVYHGDHCYIILSPYAPRDFDPFLPSHHGALMEAYSWISSPAGVRCADGRDTVTYDARHYNQVTAMMRRALGWEEFAPAVKAA